MTDESMEDRLRRMEDKPSEADAPQENPLELLAMYKKELDAYKSELKKLRAENEAYKQKEQQVGNLEALTGLKDVDLDLSGKSGCLTGLAGVAIGIIDVFRPAIPYLTQYAACVGGIVAGAYYLDAMPVVVGAASGAVVAAVELVKEGDHLDIPDFIAYLCYGALGGAAVGYGASVITASFSQPTESARKLVANTVGVLGGMGGSLGLLAKKIHEDILY